MSLLVGDAISDLNTNIERLNRRLANADLGGDEYNITTDGSPSTGGPTYFTTGEGGLLVDLEEFEDDVAWGFPARTVNLRFDAPIVVSFIKPFDNQTVRIPLFAENSPFTIGDGSSPVGADRVWLKKMPVETDDGSEPPDPVVHILAKR